MSSCEAGCMSHVSHFRGSVMRFLPPVVITDSQLETLVDVFGTQLEAAIDAQHRQQK